MARVLDIDHLPPSRGGTTPAPWSRWADGKFWELKQGEDFDTTPERARFAVKRWAQRRGLRTNTRVPDEKTLIVRIYDPV